MQSLSSLSPIRELESESRIGPPPSTLHQQVHFDQNAFTPAPAQGVKVQSTSGKAACTSTPNTAGKEITDRYSYLLDVSS